MNDFTVPKPPELSDEKRLEIEREIELSELPKLGDTWQGFTRDQLSGVINYNAETGEFF